jgi:hypothetical protein
MTNGVSTLVASDINGTTATLGINGVGYNVKDGYMWGYDINSERVIKIFSNGNIQYFTVAGLPAGLNFTSGDVSPDGVLYLYSSGATTVYRVGLVQNSRQ